MTLNQPKGHKVGMIHCNWCGGKMIDRLTDIKRGSAKKYCSHSCANLASNLPQNKAKEFNGNWKGGISENKVRYLRIQKERYPLETQCRDKTARLIKKGILERKPCQICGNPDSQAHHFDYNNPIDVEWHCSKCHRELHDKKDLNIIRVPHPIKRFSNGGGLLCLKSGCNRLAGYSGYCKNHRRTITEHNFNVYF